MTDEAKFRLGVAIGAVLLLCGAVTWFIASAPGLCGNDLLSETPSPSGKLKVVVFERSCGATTGYVKQASVLRAGENLGNDDAGNLATSHGYWTLKWLTNDQLLVEYTGVKPAPATRQINGVYITYKEIQ
jgi:hypothetical protein